MYRRSKLPVKFIPKVLIMFERTCNISYLKVDVSHAEIYSIPSSVY